MWQWCERCSRTAEPREPYGYTWGVKPIPADAKYVPSRCPLCDLELKEEQKRKYYAGVRRTQRRLAHKEPFPEGLTPADPFEGFRE